jgi:hypothetical protein
LHHDVMNSVSNNTRSTAPINTQGKNIKQVNTFRFVFHVFSMY